jgi:hypothetical protein
VSLVTESNAEPVAQPFRLALSDRFALGWRHVVLCTALSAFFVYLSYVPLFHSDIWGHVHYGTWIIENGQLPQEDPFLPLAEGVPVIDNAWLAQVTFAEAEAIGGPQGMSSLFALTVFATYLIYARIFFLFSRSPLVVVAGLFLLLFVGFSRHAIIRPEIFGGLCLAALFWMLVRVEPWRQRVLDCRGKSGDDRWPLWMWFCIPIMFLFWANAHGSFAVGLVVLGCHSLGSIIEVLWKTRNPLAVFFDRGCQRWILLTELAVAATLINPYGLDLLIQTARFGQNANLRDVMEWYPLKLIDLEGIQFCISIVLMLVLLRHSRIRMRATEVLMLVVFAFSVAPTIRMIGWYAPLFAFLMVPHLANVVSRGRRVRQRTPERQETSKPQNQDLSRFAGTLICIVVLWCGFAVSPISRPLLGGTPREKEMIFSRDTPHGVTEYLLANPPNGLVFAPQWWGDYLNWSGPSDMKVFMTTNLHLAPRQVWRDYLRVARGQSGWEGVLDKYDVKTLVVHKELQVPMARNIRRTRLWRIVYEDSQGAVLQRISST